jgi:hypothetical protein
MNRKKLEMVHVLKKATAWFIFAIWAAFTLHLLFGVEADGVSKFWITVGAAIGCGILWSQTQKKSR